MRRALIGLAAALGLLGGPAAAHASDFTEDPVVILMGGERPGALDCRATAGKLQTFLRGYSQQRLGINHVFGEVTTVSSEPGDTGCDAALSAGANPTTRDVALAFSTWLRDRYPDKRVDVVAHGTAGLALRYALAMAGTDDSWPHPLHVGDAITLDTPHDGSALLAASCPQRAVCQDADPGSPLLAMMAQPQFQRPNQAGDVTDWSVIGSTGDPLVTGTHATALDGAHKTIYDDPAMGRDAFLTDTSLKKNEPYRYAHAGGTLTAGTKGPHPALRIAQDLMFGPRDGGGNRANCTGFNDDPDGATQVESPDIVDFDPSSDIYSVIRNGTMEAYAACFKRENGRLESDSLVLVNGFVLQPAPNTTIEIDPAKRELYADDASVWLPIKGHGMGVISSETSRHWTYPAGNGSIDPNSGELLKLSGEAKIGGLKLKGGIGITASRGSMALDVNLALPTIFSGTGSFGDSETESECTNGIDDDVDGKVDADDPECDTSRFESGDGKAGPAIAAKVSTSNKSGLAVDKLTGKLGGDYSIGSLKLAADLSFTYNGADGSWEAAAEVTLPLSLGSGARPKIGAVVGVRNGDLIKFEGSVDGLNAGPIGPGLYLQRAKLGFTLDPVSITSGVGFSYGPRLAGAGYALWEVYGELKVSATSAKLTGEGTFLGDRLAKGSLDWTFGQSLKADLTIGKTWQFPTASGEKKPLVQLNANFGAKGLFDATGFDIQGDGQLCAKGTFGKVGSLETCLGNARARVSEHGERVALSACAGYKFLGVTYEIGGGIVWPRGLEGPADSSYMTEVCDVDRWHASADASQAGGERAFTMGTRGELIGVVGFDGPPDVTLHGPHGETLHATPGTAPAQTGDLVVVPSAGDATTYILVGRPSAGRWTVSGDGIADLKVADTLPEPKVTGGLRHLRGRAYELDYTANDVPGQAVRFVERSGGTRHELGAGKAGRLRFRAGEAGSRARTIVAEVTSYGSPRAELTVARFTAPVVPGPGRASHVRLRRHGSHATVSWRPAPHAGGYVVLLRSPGGLVTRRDVGVRTRRVTFGRLFAAGRLRVGIAARDQLTQKPARAVEVSAS